jgi:hypothetical protein
MTDCGSIKIKKAAEYPARPAMGMGFWFR